MAGDCADSAVGVQFFHASGHSDADSASVPYAGVEGGASCKHCGVHHHLQGGCGLRNLVLL